MAYTTGTCNGHKALLGALKTFLDAQSYTAERYSANDEYIFSKTFSGSDKWYSGIKIYDNVATNARAWKLRGMSAYNSSAAFDAQIGISGNTNPALSLDENISNSTFLTYWFVASNRRVAGVVRIGTSYQHFYMGLFLPYCTPTQYPYPIITGGNTVVQSDGTIPRYDTSTSGLITQYWHPFYSTNSSTPSSLNIRTPQGNWRPICGYTGSTRTTGRGIYPYSNKYGTSSFYSSGTEIFTGSMLFMKPSPNGCYNLLPIVIYDNNPTAVYGELEGFKYLSGFSMTAETSLTVGADTYIVFPNGSIGGDGNFIAMKTA